MTECARLITPQMPYFIDRHGHLKAIDRLGPSRRSCPRTLNMQIKLQCEVNEIVALLLAQNASDGLLVTISSTI